MKEIAQKVQRLMREKESQFLKDLHWFHENPEMSFQEYDTTAYIKRELEDMGVELLDVGLETGVVGMIRGKKEHPCIALRADIDALPVTEESSCTYPSKRPGMMHACGHDMHTAMLLGAAKLLKAHEDELEGTVKLMFQPAEEIFEGSRDMIQAGLLKNPDVDGALMIHVMAGMPFEAGTVIVSAPGVSAPAADYFEIRVQGTGCHGSMPYAGVDPLNAAAHILIALQEIHARELAMDDRAVLTFGTMNAGTAANVIPDVAVMGGSIRTFDEEIRALIKERMVQIADGIARSFRAEANVKIGRASCRERV